MSRTVAKSHPRSGRPRSWRALSGLATLALGLGLFIIGSEAQHSDLHGSTTPQSAETRFCPLQTAAQWQHFLAYYADEDEWIDTCEDSSCDADFHDYIAERVQTTFERCAGFLAKNPGIRRCAANMRRFTPAWLAQHSDDSYGFTVDNHRYLAEQDGPGMPAGMMQPPQTIIDALPNRKAVEAAARRGGWKYLTHDSAIEGVRTFVVVPDPAGRFDLWILLNLPENSQIVNESMPLSVISVQKRTAAGAPLARVRLQFRDYAMEPRAGGLAIEANEDANGKCYSCHPNGVRQLIARRTPVLDARPVKGEPAYDPSGAAPPPPDFAFQRLLEFNRKLRSYGAPDWAGRIRPGDHGPILGAALGCADCHNGVARSALNLSTSLNQVRQKVRTELTMPPDTDLPRLLERQENHLTLLPPADEARLAAGADEAEKLVQAFAASRFTALKEWFLATPCR